MNSLNPTDFITYQNQWIATSPKDSRVLTSAPTLKEIEKKLMEIKNKDAVLTYITPPDKFLSPLCR